MFKFIPKKLIAVREEISRQHANIGENKDIKMDLDGVRFIKRLSELSEEDARKEALILTKREMDYIACYIPANSYNVKLDNLFLIFRRRTSERLCEILFRSWQNSFECKECNEFLILLLEKDENFRKLIQTHYLSLEIYKEILEDDYVSIAFGREVKRISYTQKMDFGTGLEFLGILNTSQLYRECKFLFYIFCDCEDYLCAGDSVILGVIRKYGKIMHLKFLENFLEKLSLNELKKFTLLAKYFSETIGDTRKTVEEYFHGSRFVLIRKYLDWINTYIINKLFGKDERSAFWEEYRFESVVRYDYSDSVIMEFKNFVGIEFLGKAMGPFYIYKKSYFEKELKDSFQFKMYDNSDLRSYLYKRKDYNNNSVVFGRYNAIRHVHTPNPGWSSIFEQIIRRNCVTEKIQDIR